MGAARARGRCPGTPAAACLRNQEGLGVGANWAEEDLQKRMIRIAGRPCSRCTPLVPKEGVPQRGSNNIRTVSSMLAFRPSEGNR